jgi:phage shock protein A
MALMLGQLYDALRAGNVPDDKARAAAEEVANYEGEIAKLRVEVSEIKSDVRLLKWMMGFVLAFQVANFFLQFR